MSGLALWNGVYLGRGTFFRLAASCAVLCAVLFVGPFGPDPLWAYLCVSGGGAFSLGLNPHSAPLVVLAALPTVAFLLLFSDFLERSLTSHADYVMTRARSVGALVGIHWSYTLGASLAFNLCGMLVFFALSCLRSAAFGLQGDPRASVPGLALVLQCSGAVALGALVHSSLLLAINIGSIRFGAVPSFMAVAFSFFALLFASSASSSQPVPAILESLCAHGAFALHDIEVCRSYFGTAVVDGLALQWSCAWWLFVLAAEAVVMRLCLGRAEVGL